jgi:hypothetical protein
VTEEGVLLLQHLGELVDSHVGVAPSLCCIDFTNRAMHPRWWPQWVIPGVARHLLIAG